MESLRSEIGEFAKTEEDILSYAMFPEIGREFLEQRENDALIPEPLEPPRSKDDGPHSAPIEFNASLHGESYHIKVTGAGHKGQNQRPFYVTVDGVPEEILIETLDEIMVMEDGSEVPATAHRGSKRPRATSPGHVTTSMPGSIVEVLVEVGSEVKAGDAILITEAMKMETEIQAPISGTISAVHVAKGDSVNPDEALVEIE